MVISAIYYFYIDFLKAIAVLLIINSHMDPIYPHSFLATGGAMGNALFFFCSGFLLRGREKNKAFFTKFLLRIYIPVMIISFILGCEANESLISQLVWPTSYWFIGAIVLFYLLYSILEKLGIFNYYKVLIIFLTLLYLYLYLFYLDTSVWVVEKAGLYDLESGFKLIYYFVIMVFGGVVRNCNLSKGHIGKFKYLWGVSVVLLYLSKFVIDKYTPLMCLQFTSQLFTLSFAIGFGVWSMESEFVKRVSKSKVLSLFIKKISVMSLELYLIQFILIRFWSETTFFPINVIGLLSSLLLVGRLFLLINKKIIQILVRYGSII